MKSTKDSQPLKPLTPNRSYLRKFIDKFKPTQNGKQIKKFIERDILYSIVLLSFVISLLLNDYKRGFMSFVGSLILVFILLVFFYRDLQRYKPAYLKKKKMLALLGSLFIFNLVSARLFEHFFSIFSKGLNIENFFIHYFGIPLAIGAVIVVMIFDFHTAITFSLILSLMIGIWIKISLFPLFVFITCLIAAFSLIRVKKRSDIINAGSYIVILTLVSSLSILFINEEITFESFYFLAVFSLINGFSVSALCFLFLPVVEKLFKIATPLSLIELLDIDHPLMKQLSLEAPGTYHHSMIVGSLAESAAEVVGVSPLLAKAAAYYHDIGKIRMPEYFIENQSGCISKHEKLNPHLSSMIIISHVKDGVELAQEYNLPEIIKDVIQQHHGTSLVTYFYQKALKEQESPPSEIDYRYPGPKPQTKLAALIMLADAIEASARTLDEPTPARISNLIDKIIKNIFLDGQLDDCEITLKDLIEIKKRFEHVLTGIFHKRIPYPETEKKD
ncbi:HDIG domain-containing metalloprotein [Thermodesulfovibrio sp.]|uniref:HD family phosphohydrolase n=1 Tax=Thermodesulfovibrio sp. TaxID=2067987 RepID=UPI00309D5C4E